MRADHPLAYLLKKHSASFHPVLGYEPAASDLVSLDLSPNNHEFTPDIFSDTGLFTSVIMRHIAGRNAKFAFGGYDELREMYSKSNVFDAGGEHEEPRRIHVGLDIWGPAGTPVFAPLGGELHSSAMNGADGDYGSTLVLRHSIEGSVFHTLYGHLSESDLVIEKGASVAAGQKIGHFGNPDENGNWPPHLHFQIIIDMGAYEGDYPGVCRFSERDKYLLNCPDPDLIFQITRYLHV
jgi:murein DD-endopeptidase MepM/ murein hydrolase activator NlpD